MKELIACVVIISLAFALSAQNITESLVNLRKKYNPIFGTQSSILTLDFTRSYTLNQSDTSFAFLLNVSQTEMEAQGFSLGYSVFSVGSLFGGNSSSSSQYAIKRTKGNQVLGYDAFNELYSCANMVYRFIGTKQMLKSNSYNTICSCDAGDMTLAAEYVPSNLAGELKFYFRFGEDAAFKMTKEEYEEIMLLVRSIKAQWDKINMAKP